MLGFLAVNFAELNHFLDFFLLLKLNEGLY